MNKTVKGTLNFICLSTGVYIGKSLRW